MINYRLYIFLGAAAFTSCTTTMKLTSSVKPTEVTDLQKFEPLSYISLIESANNGRYNDTISNEVKELINGVLNSYGNRIRLSGDISVSDSLIKKRIEQETEYLCLTADKQRNISNLKLTPTLDSLLEANQKRFGLITVTTGFTRMKGNYGKQIAKGIGMGILTLGTYYKTPVKANSTIYAMIIDSRDNNIAFFRKSILQDEEPFDENVLKKQIQDIFNGYFWTTN